MCIDRIDLLEQYNKINKKQHFGKANITEEWYIRNIKTFIKDARDNIPVELSNIVKNADFIWKENKAEIGTLRLMPKVLKLKTINKDNVENLNSRGIKSSMNDPIKLVQKTLDKLYNHRLFFIEREFLRIFGALSPSVTGVSEAIERIKKFKNRKLGNIIRNGR